MAKNEIPDNLLKTAIRRTSAKCSCTSSKLPCTDMCTCIDCDNKKTSAEHESCDEFEDDENNYDDTRVEF